MTQCAHIDEDMPYRVIVGMLFVFSEEIGPDGIEDAFCEDPEEGLVGHIPPHGNEHQQGRPPHRQIQGEREAGIFTESDKFAYRAGDDACPQEGEEAPSHPTADDAQTYR